MKLILSLPPAEVWPNWRPGPKKPGQQRKASWRRVSEVKAAYRDEAKKVGMAALKGHRPRWRRATAWLTFYFPDLRKRDKTNAAAAMKPAWDGLIHEQPAKGAPIRGAGLLEDDDELLVYPPVFALDRKRPRVEVVVVEGWPGGEDDGTAA